MTWEQIKKEQQMLTDELTRVKRRKKTSRNLEKQDSLKARLDNIDAIAQAKQISERRMRRFVKMKNLWEHSPEVWMIRNTEDKRFEARLEKELTLDYNPQFRLYRNLEDDYVARHGYLPR